MNVALFITCLTDQFYPHVGVAVTKILEHFGCRVSFPQSQTCCGQPFFNNGFHDESRELAKRFIEIFEPYEYIVTPSGSCAAMVREQYEYLLKDNHAYAHGMHAITSRTYEFVEFLDKVLKVDFSQFKLPVSESCTYHYTCHLRGIGVKDEGLKLLQQIGGVDFTPLEKTDQCCGFGGTFAVKYPAISGAIVEDKADCIAATGARTVICNDAGCTMNISGMLHRREQKQQVRHIAELMAEAMGIDMNKW
ncbi:MAG: L-lactate dehydrogenase complex protein LldE [Phycisphaerales bacterium]|jgi:L-lactate dehydrogenase complex protein LldE|nr:L-lactate dehydrogenase complex protein LldE [Phycisphaerales bacterium]